MKGEVIDFEVLRIQSELENYSRTETLPHLLLNGAYNIDEIFDAYYDKLTPKHKLIADHLKSNYTTTLKHCITSLRMALKKEYVAVMRDLSTEHESFIFDHVMNKYRPGMNPVRALYYEVREVKKFYTSTNDYYVWLVTTLADKPFRNILLDAVGKDIARLEKILQQFYVPIVNNSRSIPLELFHAKQTVSDFRHYYTVFEAFDPEAFD
jgi:hypothetical protein|tara:strand:- start:298 stop:924 length:627 start_codon:yes stop_codon:yes gene_type:complete